MTRDEMLALWDRMVAEGWEPAPRFSGQGFHPVPTWPAEQQWTLTWKKAK